MEFLKNFQAGASVPMCPSRDIVRQSFSSMILSASGFRKIFSSDGIEESASPAVTAADAALTAFIGRAFAEFCRRRTGKTSLTIALGTDTRPTGASLADLLIRIFSADGINVRYSGATAVPELTAWVKTDADIDAFVYVSASHNPIGHNGFKFGFEDGAVMEPEAAAVFIEEVRSGVKEFQPLRQAAEDAAFAPSETTAAVFNRQPQNKAAAFDAYLRFTKAVLSGESETKKQEAFFARFADEVKTKRLGMVIDFNGSARTLSVDGDFLSSLGIKLNVINQLPGQIVHRIVPEGISLEPCRTLLEKTAREESFQSDSSRFVLGYLPDNDGDRGNIVYLQDDGKTAAVLEAQQLFALCVLAELAALTAAGVSQPTAVAVNDCTSDRIEAIASVFGTKVFRAETGEANVVNLARRLRKEGYLVRILGEGSNGGNITDPATIRDPLNTIGSLLKLLTQPQLFRLWCERTGQPFSPDYTLQTIIDSLPPYTTTGAYEPQAKVVIRTDDHGALKAAYEELFPRYWENQLLPLRQELGVTEWREFNYEKTEEKEGVGAMFRSGAQRGGFKIRFYDSNGEAAAYVWMRGSGTEPVFRVSADVKGSRPQTEAELLRIHTDLIAEADNRCR